MEGGEGRGGEWKAGEGWDGMGQREEGEGWRETEGEDRWRWREGREEEHKKMSGRGGQEPRNVCLHDSLSEYVEREERSGGS